MTHTEKENIRAKRLDIICKTCKTKLAESVTNGKNFFALPPEQINELRIYAKLFNYNQRRRSLYEGISYLRDFYYYLSE